jgi:hypothetical protein
VVTQAVRDHMQEIDCDCDSSVLTDLDDDTTVDVDDPWPRPEAGDSRVLRRQTGQSALSCAPRPPVALSRSDFLVLDDTIQPHFDVTMQPLNSSLNATRGSLPDLDDVSTPRQKPRRRSRRSQRSYADENHPPQASLLRRSRTRPQPCGRESEPDSGVSCSSRGSADDRRSAIRVLDKPTSTLHRSDVDQRSIARRLRRFNTPNAKHAVKIKTLGVF